MREGGNQLVRPVESKMCEKSRLFADMSGQPGPARRLSGRIQAIIATSAFTCYMRNAQQVASRGGIGKGQVLSDQQVEPDHLGRPRLGGSGRSLAAMVTWTSDRGHVAEAPRMASTRSAPERDMLAEQRADVAPMRARPGLATTAAASVRPKTGSLKFLCRSADRPLFFRCDGAKNSAVERYTNRYS
jgi:hypothetical protein